MSVKQKYPNSHEIYAKWYGVSARSIRGWVTIGRLAGEFPPLDDPEKMPDWWRRHQKSSIPQKIFEAPDVKKIFEQLALSESELGVAAGVNQAEKNCRAKISATDESKKFCENENNREGERAPRLLDDFGSGIAATLKRLEAVERELCEKYLDKAQDPTCSDTDLARAQRRWESATEALRKFQKDAPGMLKAQGELLVRSEISTLVQRAHGAIRMMVEAMLKRVRPRLGELDERSQDAVWDEEVQLLFREMNDLEFALEKKG